MMYNGDTVVAAFWFGVFCGSGIMLIAWACYAKGKKDGEAR